MTYFSEGDTTRLITQGSVLYAASHFDALGEDSPWDYSAVEALKQDSKTMAMFNDFQRYRKDGKVRMDDGVNGAGYLAESLTWYDPEYVEEEYQETLYADPTFLNIKQLNRPGVRRIKVQNVDRVGRFRMISDRATDTDALDAGMLDTDYPTKYFGAHVTYTSQELDAMDEAQRNGNVFGFLNIVSYKMTSVVQAAYRDEMNRINSVGLTRAGIGGLHSFYGLPRFESPIQLTETSTPEEFVSVFDTGIRRFLANTGEKYRPNMVLMSEDLRETMSSRLIGTSASISLLDWILRQKNISNVYTTPEMKTAIASGPFLQFCRMSDATSVNVTKGLAQNGAPYRQGGATRVDYEFATAGLIAKKPFEHLIMENVGI